MASSPSSTRKALQSILKLNSKGTKQYLARRYGKAIESYTSAVSKTKVLLSSEDPSLNLFTLGFRFQSTTPLHHHQDIYTHNDDDQSQNNNTSNATLCFQSPILVVQEDASTSSSGSSSSTGRRSNQSTSSSSTSPPSNSLMSLSFALVYNLAISFHMSVLHHPQNQIKKNQEDTVEETTDGKNHNDEKESISSSSKHRRRLEKALTLYQTAHELLEKHRHDMLASVGVLERMALWNNMGSIHTSLGNSTESLACYQEIMQRIMVITHNIGGDRRRSIYQFDLFFQNAMTNCCILKPTQSAPAA